MFYKVQEGLAWGLGGVELEADNQSLFLAAERHWGKQRLTGKETINTTKWHDHMFSDHLVPGCMYDYIPTEIGMLSLSQM